MTSTPPPNPRAAVLPDTKQINILHIEDDPSFADLVTTFLERQNEQFTVSTETDPTDALETIKEGNIAFDCVVSDYDMPGLNGLDVLKRIREYHSELPFILFTGKGSEEIASEAITAGVTEYLQKGGSTEQYQVLANRIQNAVERYWAERYLDRGLEAIETAQDGISILSEDGHIEYLNTACADLLGYERNELIGLHWETFYRDEDVDRVYDELLPAARDERWHGETSFVRKDGSLLDVTHSLSYTDDGSLICILSNPEPESAASDLSIRERAMHEAPVGICITDPCLEDNPIIYVNDKFTSLTGYDEKEALGRNCRFLQGEQTQDERVSKLREAIDNGEATTVELRNYRADGSEFWNRVRIAPLFDDEGDIEYFVGFQDDVTEAKAREEQLQSQSSRLEALFEHSPDMIAVHNADGIICDVNQRLCEELNYTEEEIIGKTVWELDPTAKSDRARKFWGRLPINDSQRFEGELQRKDGSTFPIEIHLIRLNLEGKDRYVAMDRDITEQTQQKEELVEQNERLDRFTSVVSHDLRNPLNVAEGHLELLAEESDSEHIQKIRDAHDRMDDLIEDLLTLAQTGDSAMELETVSLEQTARKSWAAVATEDATLNVTGDRTVEADVDQLHQLFENLFRNAIEHGSHEVTVTVGTTTEGFYVEDDGRGIPESERAKIFEEGFTTTDDGTGFGLSIVSNVVDAHSWEITATDGADGGARFEISLLC